MSRAAVLVGGPDPFLDAEWLRNYATWRSEVNALYVIICGQQDRDLRAYISEKVEALGGTLVEFAPALDHGVAIGRVLAALAEASLATLHRPWAETRARCKHSAIEPPTHFPASRRIFRVCFRVY